MTEDELKALEIDHEVDARGTACPGPLLEAKRAIASVDVGGIMLVISSDEGTRNDIPMWCNKVGHEWLGDYEEDGDWYVLVKRMK